jgi:hypothetical protein
MDCDNLKEFINSTIFFFVINNAAFGCTEFCEIIKYIYLFGDLGM